MSNDQRHWTAAEIDLLFDLVAQDYNFLTGALTDSKIKTMVDNKWSDLTSKINAIGASTQLLLKN